MRKAGLDLCRIAACLAVVSIHTVMLFWDFDPAAPAWAVFNFLSLAVRFGVPLFFMLSGALLLGRERLDFGKHLRRTGHFVLLFYLWSLIGYGLDAALFHVWTPGGDFLSLVLSGYYHEWFLAALVLCYCAVPLLHGLIHGERDNARKGAWLLCGVVIGLATLSAVPDKPPILAALLAPWKLSDLRYLVYFLLGWQLDGKKLTRRGLGLLGASALAVLLLFARLNRTCALSLGQAAGPYYGYLLLPAALTAAFVFCLCQQAEAVSPRAAGLLQRLSGCVFGVYLLHPLCIDALRGLHLPFESHSALWLLPACYLGFLLTSLGLTALLKKLPLLRELVR